MWVVFFLFLVCFYVRWFCRFFFLIYRRGEDIIFRIVGSRFRGSVVGDLWVKVERRFVFLGYL